MYLFCFIGDFIFEALERFNDLVEEICRNLFSVKNTTKYNRLRPTGIRIQKGYAATPSRAGPLARRYI